MGRKKLQWILKKQGGRVWVGLIWLRIRTGGRPSVSSAVYFWILFNLVIFLTFSGQQLRQTVLPHWKSKLHKLSFAANAANGDRV